MSSHPKALSRSGHASALPSPPHPGWATDYLGSFGPTPSAMVSWPSHPGPGALFCLPQTPSVPVASGAFSALAPSQPGQIRLSWSFKAQQEAQLENSPVNSQGPCSLS